LSDILASDKAGVAGGEDDDNTVTDTFAATVYDTEEAVNVVDA
jgi:hypothetical protein